MASATRALHRCHDAALAPVFGFILLFFAWGMMPIGAALGGAIVWIAEQSVSHTMALRTVWFVDGAVHLVLFVVGRRLLTTERMESARAEAVAAR